MGIRIETEIAASPTQVKSICLDWPNLSTWHTSFICGIRTIPPGQDARTLQKGDKILADVPSVKNVEMTVLRNDNLEFRWTGGIFFNAFAGEHYFRFEPSSSSSSSQQGEETQQRTTFVHGEDYTGWASFLCSPGWPLHRKMVENFTAYSRDLKSRAEDGTFSWV